jgi:hypothetical protein
MPVTPEDLDQFAGQKVVVTYQPKGKTENVEVEGLAEAANAMGIVLKPKGRQNNELIEIDQIDEVVFAPEKLKELKQQDLTPLKYGAARKHLLDRHAGKLNKVNSLSEEDALKAHADTDHSNLGHQHVEKKAETPAEENAPEPAAV